MNNVTSIRQHKLKQVLEIQEAFKQHILSVLLNSDLNVTLYLKTIASSLDFSLDFLLKDELLKYGDRVIILKELRRDLNKIKDKVEMELEKR